MYSCKLDQEQFIPEEEPYRIQEILVALRGAKIASIKPEGLQRIGRVV